MTRTIRRATMSDVPNAITLSRITQNEHADRLPTEFKADDSPLAEAAYPQILTGKTQGAVFVATEDDTLVGHLGYYLHNYPAPGGRHHRAATILDLTVAPDRRGTGVGRDLASRALRQMKDDGVTRVDAQVWTGNTASQALFESLGFQSVFNEFRLHTAPSKAGRPQVANPGWTRTTLWLAFGLAALILLFASR